MHVVLLVEDNEMNRDMLSRRLRRQGYAVELACDGDEAIRLAGLLHPALILMDISLPKLDGHAATRVLRQQPETRSIPIIALTAHAMAEDRRGALESGCDDFETKPVELSRLLKKIDFWIGQRWNPPKEESAPALTETI